MKKILVLALIVALLPLAKVEARFTFGPPRGDFCQEMQAKIKSLSSGGIIDATNVAGAYTCAAGFYVPRGVTVELGAVRLTVGDTVYVYEGGGLIGVGVAPDFGLGTQLVAKDGLNKPVLWVQNSSGPHQSAHWVTVKHLRIEGNALKQAPGTDCVRVSQLGEAALVQQLIVYDCIGDGIEFTGNMAGSGSLDYLSVFYAREAAFHFNNTTSVARGSMFKGDGNRHMLKVTPGYGGFVLQLRGLSGEIGAPDFTDNEPFIVHDGSVSGASITIWGLYPPGGSTRQDLIKFIGPNYGILNLYDVHVLPNYTNFLNDTTKAKVIKTSDLGSGSYFVLPYFGYNVKDTITNPPPPPPRTSRDRPATRGLRALGQGLG